MEQLITAIIAMSVTVIGSLTTFIVTRLKLKSVTTELEAITKAVNGGIVLYYINCPKCGHKVYLNEVTIFNEPNKKEV